LEEIAVKVFSSASVPVEPVEHGKGVSIQWLIDRKQGAPNFAMRLFEVQPGGSTPFHNHDWEHEVFILEGEGAVKGPGAETPLKAGDVAYVAPNEQHQFASTGQGPLRFICIVPILED
jgi:quercetin dioxygenase-like cupin family protein